MEKTENVIYTLERPRAGNNNLRFRLRFRRQGTGSTAEAVRSRKVIKLETSMGDIIIELYPEKAPQTVKNFLDYVGSGAYDGTIFHRVINGFMIQGGGMDKDMRLRPTQSPIANEADNGLKNLAYTVAMARSEDPHSATNQFFINVKNNSFLDHPGQDGWGYAVFGKVSKGHNVVNKIKAVTTTSRQGHDDVPAAAVEIIKAVRLDQ
jgi:cyclophilin family peptidyl-prolyl cis-trans isomerase